jgi:linoleoyl-CoA desaturase
MLGEVIPFTKEAKWYNFHRFQQYYSVFLYGLFTFNLAYNRFQQMKLLEKKTIVMAKLKKPKKHW